MKLKLSILNMCLICLVFVSCGSDDKKGSTDAANTNSTWTEERKAKEIKDCITSMMFKKENDALPEDTKKAVCECSVATKMARFPNAESANIDMASEIGVQNIMKFRDSCIAAIVK